MATFTLEDLRASIEVFVFPKVMAEVGALLADDAVVVLRGRVDTRDDQVKLVCMEVTRPELAVEGASELQVQVPVGIFTDDVVDRLKELLGEHPGDEPVFLHRGRDGPAAVGRIQREQPPGARRRAPGPAGPERHRLTSRTGALPPVGDGRGPGTNVEVGTSVGLPPCTSRIL